MKKGARSREYESSLHWLLSSGMVYRCKTVTAPVSPLKDHEDAETFRLLLNDPGLLANVLGIRLPSILQDEPLPYKGILAETYVAAQLTAMGVPLFYWRNENLSTVDFLLDTKDGVIPLEIRIGASRKISSLKSFGDRYRPPWSLRLTNNNFGFATSIRSIPLYAAFCLDSVI
jgi:predicted AAA+ superfamily ATPase